VIIDKEEQDGGWKNEGDKSVDKTQGRGGGGRRGMGGGGIEVRRRGGVAGRQEGGFIRRLCRVGPLATVKRKKIRGVERRVKGLGGKWKIVRGKKGKEDFLKARKAKTG